MEPHEILPYMIKFFLDGKIHKRAEAPEYMESLPNFNHEPNKYVNGGRLMSKTAYYTRWCHTFLKHTGFLDNSKRGFWQITSEGKTMNPAKVCELALKASRNVS